MIYLSPRGQALIPRSVWSQFTDYVLRITGQDTPGESKPTPGVDGVDCQECCFLVFSFYL